MIMGKIWASETHSNILFQAALLSSLKMSLRLFGVIQRTQLFECVRETIALGDDVCSPIMANHKDNCLIQQPKL